MKIPKNYSSTLGVIETEIAIKRIKDFFENGLSKELNLTRVSAPLFVKSETGLNDNLNGVEKPVSFNVRSDNNSKVEIVQSLAKWKRMALSSYGFVPGSGLYTDMNAIRPDEEFDHIHSIYVDQWDWEKIILRSQRNEDTLKDTIRKIYKVFKETEIFVSENYETIKPILPEEISFITTQELEDMYPTLTPKEREHAIAKDRVAVFIMKIGDKLKSGAKHDGRSPDYDDWSLNGDIIFWNPVIEEGLELSSMGIRVDSVALEKQLKAAGAEERKSYPYHRLLLEDKLPFTIGGGIGQSRICMYFLRKAHIGEVQASIWPEEMIKLCAESQINLL